MRLLYRIPQIYPPSNLAFVHILSISIIQPIYGTWNIVPYPNWLLIMHFYLQSSRIRENERKNIEISWTVKHALFSFAISGLLWNETQTPRENERKRHSIEWVNAFSHHRQKFNFKQTKHCCTKVNQCRVFGSHRQTWLMVVWSSECDMKSFFGHR